MTNEHDIYEEISGDVSLTEQGLILIGMELGHQTLRWGIRVTDNGYLLSHKNETVEVTDIISAKVECATIIRKLYDYPEHAIDCVKQLIEEAWIPPRIAKHKIEEMVMRYEEL